MKKRLAKNIQYFGRGCVNVMQKGQNKEDKSMFSIFLPELKIIRNLVAWVQKCSFPLKCRMCNKLD